VNENKSWLSLVGYCCATVFGVALAFALIMAGASVALAGHQNSEESQQQEQAIAPPAAEEAHPAEESHPADLTTFSGMITDSYCGARHRRRSNLNSSECAARCIRRGASYVLVAGDHRYNLSGAQDSLSKLVGTRANISGTREGDSISVTTAEPMF
jgi:hypothetical protein